MGLESVAAAACVERGTRGEDRVLLGPLVTAAHPSSIYQALAVAAAPAPPSVSQLQSMREAIPARACRYVDTVSASWSAVVASSPQ